MANLKYTVQRPGDGTAILNAYRDLATSATFSRLTGLYAFASLKGARLLVGTLQPSPSWNAASKRWVISIDGGITEPEALRFLIGLRKSEVRVPDAEGLLGRKLKPVFRFHPKTLLLEQQNVTLQPAAMLVGSANLTCSGLCFGHEHALSAQAVGAALPVSLASGLQSLERVVADATVIDEAFVDRYAAVRPARPTITEEFEDERANQILQDRPAIPANMSASLAAATHFWIDIEYVVDNRGPREEGNQIDMQRGSRVFFGFGDQTLTTNSPIGSVRISYGAHSASRNLRFGNNSMDKLDLPILGVEGPPSYSHQTLLFTRDGPRSFRLSVGTAAEIAAWKARSSSLGTSYSMRSGRKFGVF